MAKRSPSQTPLAILVVGLVTVTLFGGSVWLVTDRTPIMKLRPTLEKAYKTYDFKCWLKLDELRIEVLPPATLELDTLGRRHLGATALAEYLRLANYRTQIESVHVLGRHGEPPEIVTQAQVDLLQGQENVTALVLQRVSIATATTATVALYVPAKRGNAVVLDLPPEVSEVLARRAVTAAAEVPGVVFVRVRRGPSDPVLEGGTEVETFRPAKKP